MARFITSGPVAICDRCGMKMLASARVRDGDTPCLWVHAKCRDEIDPYKLPPHQLEQIALRYPRPDAALGVDGEVLSTEQGAAWTIATESGDDIEVTE